MEETKNLINRFINSQDWIFAKTMADIPHWYCLKRNCEDAAAWRWFVQLIDLYGVEGSFYGKTYRYLYWGEYRYWYMDPTAESCDLINRCVIPESERRFENYPKFLATAIDTK